MSEPQGLTPFRLAYVPGSTPDKWAGVWRARLPHVPLNLLQIETAAVAPLLAAGEADAALARLPVDKGVFSAIPLYAEDSVVCFSRDHVFAALADDERLSCADLVQESVWVPADDVLFTDRPSLGTVPADPDGNPLLQMPTTADAIATVAANTGVVVLPMSLARLHRRKDVLYKLVEDGPTAPVGLVWVTDSTTDLIEELIGIVRGRTVNSSRGRSDSSSTLMQNKTRSVPSGKNVSGGAISGRANSRAARSRSGSKMSGRERVRRIKGSSSESQKKRKGKGR